VQVTLETSPVLTPQGESATLGHTGGTFGSEPVHATLTAPNRIGETIVFTGTIGHFQVRGTLTMQSFSADRSTATFTLTT
jgi:hypothetical protein